MEFEDKTHLALFEILEDGPCVPKGATCYALATEKKDGHFVFVHDSGVRCLILIHPDWIAKKDFTKAPVIGPDTFAQSLDGLSAVNIQARILLERLR